MLSYLIRRSGYSFLVLLGVILFLFILFFTIASPDDIARQAVGEKALPEVIEQWKVNHGYDRPLWPSSVQLTDNLLYDHFRRLLTFQFGDSDSDGVPISQRLLAGAGPSFALTLPLFLVGLVVGVLISLFVAFFRGTYIDRLGLTLAVLAMSVSILLYIIGGQFLLGRLLRWFPVSGFEPDLSVIWRFLALPVIVGVASQVGSDIRFYRTVFVEEIYKDYVRTARAKGAGEMRIMLVHVLRAALVPIVTNVVMVIPFLFTGSLLLEAGFGIPGLGSVTVEAINSNDFSTLRAVVFLGSLLFIFGQILTDIAYTLVDPRIRLS